jgi:hypothetical protein
MRSRFNHDGTLDHHAENEHELFRRADEALDRQRRLDHAAKAGAGVQAMGDTTLSPLKSSAASPLGGAQAANGLTAPKMPHEELAERMALKPAAVATVETALAWPARTSGANAATATRSIGRRW